MSCAHGIKHAALGYTAKLACPAYPRAWLPATNIVEPAVRRMLLTHENHTITWTRTVPNILAVRLVSRYPGLQPQFSPPAFLLFRATHAKHNLFPRPGTEEPLWQPVSTKALAASSRAMSLERTSLRFVSPPSSSPISGTVKRTQAFASASCPKLQRLQVKAAHQRPLSGSLRNSPLQVSSADFTSSAIALLRLSHVIGQQRFGTVDNYR